jgi:hypothetical protein
VEEPDKRQSGGQPPTGSGYTALEDQQCWAPYLALLLAGVVGWQQALDVETVAVLLIAPQPMVWLGCPQALAFSGTPGRQGPIGSLCRSQASWVTGSRGIGRITWLERSKQGE